MVAGEGLTQKQIADLTKSGIGVEAATVCGLSSETDLARAREMLGWRVGAGVVPAMLFPYFPLGDRTKDPMFVRLRPDEVFTDHNGNRRKYLQPFKVATKIYIPPVADMTRLRDPYSPLFLTEGEKKAIKMNLEGFTCVSAPGVWNFHEPNADRCNRRLKACFQQIPLKDREVFIVFDALEFQKSDVLAAKMALATMLAAAGAHPRLVHLTDDDRVAQQAGELGADDYLMLYGREDFQNKVIASSYRYRFDATKFGNTEELSPPQREREGRKLLAYYAVADDFQKIEIEKILVEKIRLTKAAIRRFSAKAGREKENGKKEKTLPATTEDGKPIINWKTDRFWEHKVKDLVALLVARQRSYLLGSIPVFIDERGQFIHVTSPDVLSAQISEHAEINVKNDREGNRHYDALPRKDALILLSKPYFLSALPEIRAMVDLPVYDREFNLVQTGYNAADKIFMTGETLPARADIGTDYIDKILNGPCYADESSRVNRLGCLLAGLFPTHFMGNKPFILWQANTPGAGKSENALCDAIIRTGKICGNISFNPNEEEFEKQIATEVSKGLQEVIIDNAKAESRAVLISSAVLERSITSEVLNFRQLGSNSSITRPNSLFFVITANSPKLSGDLLSRSIPMNLYCEGDPDKVVYPMKSPHRWAKEHRSAIWIELIGMVERWKGAGRPLATADYRFREFAQIIGGILEVNGYRGFLGNMGAAKEMFSTDYGDLLELFSAYPTLSGSSKEFAERAQSMDLFRGEFVGKRSTGLYRSMTNILSRYVGREFHLESGELVVLTALQDSHTKSRKFAVMRSFAVMPNPASPQSNHLTPLQNMEICGDAVIKHDPLCAIQKNICDGINEKNVSDIYAGTGFITASPQNVELYKENSKMRCGDEKNASPQTTASPQINQNDASRHRSANSLAWQLSSYHTAPQGQEER